MLDMKDELLAHTYISTCMMPYITSQFVETPEDAVFTGEASCRTAMHAVYELSGVEKKQLEVAPTFYDICYVLALMKKFQNIESFTAKDLPKINPFKIRKWKNQAVTFLNQVEPMPGLFPGREKPAK